MIATYAWRLITRNLRRTGTTLFGLALAVGLFAGILFFVDATARQMTATALAPVTLDMVAHATTPDVNVAPIAGATAGQTGISAASPVVAADFASAQKAGGSRSSPVGRLFAIRPDYLQQFDLLQVSSGQFSPDGALVSEAMATALKLRPGDQLRLSFAGVADPVTLPVSGIVSMDHADALFATATEAENALVSDVVFVDQGWFAQHLQAPLTAYAGAPDTRPLPGQVILDPQVHIRIDRGRLPGDPTLAAAHIDALRRQVERAFPGQIKAVDNLSGALKAAQGDVLSAKILFIFLGLPGVALAAYLAQFATALFAEAQRRELSLLRTRGATPAQLAGMLALSALLLAVAGSALGLLIGLGALLAAAGGSAAAALNPLAPGFDWALFGGSALWAFAAGLLLTFLAAFVPAAASLRREISQERRSVMRTARPPFWKRAHLDLLALAAAAVILVITQRNGGFKPSGNEGAAISLSFYIFLAPLFAWVGSTLLVLRLVEAGLQRGGERLARLYRRPLGEIGAVAGKTIARRAGPIAAATTIIALTLSFGTSLALFQRTYAAEKQTDAQYLVGSDIRVTPALNSAQGPAFADQLMLPGVVATAGVARDTQALVGAEKNTVYGIDVASFRTVAYLPDSFFVDGRAPQTIAAMANRTTNYAPASAARILDALASTPNGVIISVEQAEKYNIQVGDPVLLRLFNRATGEYHDTRAVAVGLFIYFPTSAQDSDFILNRDFMAAQSGSSAIDYVLLKDDGQPGTTARVARALTAQFKNQLPVRVQTTATVVRVEQSSLTALNLGGLGAMERLYTVLVASLGLGVFLLAMVRERRREFGAMRALGANLGQLRRVLLAEAATIGGLSLLIGAAVGAGLAGLLVQLLGVIFTIPARGLAVPGLELAGQSALVLAGMAISTWLSARQLARLKVVDALREA